MILPAVWFIIGKKKKKKMCRRKSRSEFVWCSSLFCRARGSNAFIFTESGSAPREAAGELSDASAHTHTHTHFIDDDVMMILMVMMKMTMTVMVMMVMVTCFRCSSVRGPPFTWTASCTMKIRWTLCVRREPSVGPTVSPVVPTKPHLWVRTPFHHHHY